MMVLNANLADVMIFFKFLTRFPGNGAISSENSILRSFCVRQPFLILLYLCAVSLSTAFGQKGEKNLTDEVDSSSIAADKAQMNQIDSLQNDSLTKETAIIPFDSAAKASGTKNTDSLIRPAYANSLKQARYCFEPAQTALECLRFNRQVLTQEFGFPGYTGNLYSMDGYEKMKISSPFNPALEFSPYGGAGIAPPAEFTLTFLGLQPLEFTEVWNPLTPIDTPVAYIHWSRGAIGMNMFHLRLLRTLGKQSYFGIQYYSVSLDGRSFDYPIDQIHQPWLSGWAFLHQLYPPLKRDSSSIVFSGVTPKIDDTHLRIRLGHWVDTNQALEVFYDWIKNSSELAHPQGQGDFNLKPENGNFKSLGLGVNYFLRTGDWEWRGRFQHGSWDNHSGPDSLPGSLLEGTTDRVHLELLKKFKSGIQKVYGGYNNNLFETPLYMSTPGEESSGIQSGWTDEQVLGWELKQPDNFIEYKTNFAAKRTSLLLDRVEWGVDAGLGAVLHLPFHFSPGISISRNYIIPEIEQLYLYRPIHGYYPSPDLQPSVQTNLNPFVEWEIFNQTMESGMFFQWVENAPAPVTLPFSRLSGLPDSLSLRLENWEREQKAGFYWDVGFEFGNWRLGNRTSHIIIKSLEDDSLGVFPDNPLVPEAISRGYLAWDKLLLQGNLKTGVRWDWNWWDIRRAWASDLSGVSVPVKLDEYLILDFMVYLEVKDFIYYFKMMNFNHDQYSPAPGVHPPGVNFRFGVDWDLPG